MITQEDFEKAQESIRLNALRNPRRRLHEYMLTGGRLLCGHCGLAMSGYVAAGKYAYYRCCAPNHHEIPKHHSRIRCDKLEPWIWDCLEGILDDYEPLLRKIESAHTAEPFLRHLSTAHGELEKLSQQKSRLLDIYLDGHLPKKIYTERDIVIDEKIHAIQQTIQDLEAKVKDLDPSRYVEGIKRFQGQRYETIAERRQVIQELNIYVFYREGKVRILLPGMPRPDNVRSLIERIDWESDDLSVDWTGMR